MGSSGDGFSWIYRIFLNRTIYLAALKLQVDLSLSKSHSVLLPLVEGLHSMGYVSDADYEVNKAKYSVPLGFKPDSPTQIRQQETKENRDRQLNRHYEEILKQWDLLSDKAKAYHLKKAKTDNLKWARELLKLGAPQENEASQ